jgi:hypothetical protein
MISLSEHVYSCLDWRTSWPFWLRLSVKSIILIVIPFAVINFKANSLTALNVIISVISASVALLFAIVQITDY